MKSPTLAALALVTFSMVGCCSMNQCVGPDDPCGRELAGGGWPFQGMQLKSKKCNPYGNQCGCGSYGCSSGDVYAAGCSTGQCGSIAPPATSCGCGQPHGETTPNTPPYPVPAPYPQPAPAPIPAAAPPAPPVESPVSSQYLPPTVPVPAAAAAQPAVQASPQQISYEEFQKLPGVIISGPAPAAATTPAAVPPILTAPQPAVKPATWSSSR